MEKETNIKGSILKTEVIDRASELYTTDKQTIDIENVVIVATVARILNLDEAVAEALLYSKAKGLI